MVRVLGVARIGRRRYGRLRRWVGLIDEREQLTTAIRESPTVQGSTGQPVISPLAQHAKDLTREIERTAEHFDMRPLSRFRLHLSPPIDAAVFDDDRADDYHHMSDIEYPKCSVVVD